MSESLDPNAPIAIVGMACRLPGAGDLRAFWDLIRSGRSAWGPVPADRFDDTLYFDPERGVRGKSYTRLGGLVAYPPIDRRLCPLSEAAIASHDRAHLALCEIAAAACRDAGLNPANLPHRNTGVYVGHTRASGVAGEMTYALYVAQTAQYLREVVGWEHLGDGLPEAVIAEIIEAVRRECPARNPDGGPFLSPNYAAALIAKTFGLSGPQMVFNAACASSSQALVQAVRALQLGRIDMAIVGGASHFHSDTLVTFSQAQSVSNTGSRPFDADADGLVVAEGYVAVVLTTLDRALAERNPVRAVIRGVGISSDGRGKSLWAPRQEGQIEAIRRAYSAEVRMDRLQYIEAHATSTQLGDATEVHALAAVLRSELPDGRKIPLGSVKANLGHTLEAAGLASVVKTVLAMEHGIIPPLANCRRLNPQIDWDRVPLFVPLKEMPWEPWPDRPSRRACVNAFGIGGLNVHVVLDQLVADAKPLVAGHGFSSPVRFPNAASQRASSARAESGTGAGVGSDETTRPSRSVQQPPKSGQADHQAVAIIGMGVVLPGAFSVPEYWELLRTGRDPKSEVPPDRWNPEVFHRPGFRGVWATPTRLGGFVRGFQYDWRKHTIPPKQLAQASPLHFMVLQAVDEAFASAKLDVRTIDRRRIGVVVGTAFGGDFATQMLMGLHLPRFQRLLAQVLRQHGVPEQQIARIGREYEEVFLKHMPALLDETGSFTSSALASRITKVFDLMGGGVALDAGMASSLAALDCCVDLLVSRSCDVMVCVGAQQDMGMTKYEAWSLCGLLATGEPRAPFDAAADGCVPGEGCAALVLKRLPDAQRDGNPIYGVVRGVGAGFSMARTQAVELAMRRALERSGVARRDVALVETAGTSKPELDAQEIQAVAAVYGGQGRIQPVLLGTVTGQLGHLGAAAGMAALVKAVLALGQGFMPATGGLDEPAPFVAEYGSTIQAVARPCPIPRPDPAKPPVAGVSCGGHEVFYHALIERGTHVSLPSHDRSSEEMAARRGTPRPPLGQILHFDATARRRQRIRSQMEVAREASRMSAGAAGEPESQASLDRGAVSAPQARVPAAVVGLPLAQGPQAAEAPSPVGSPLPSMVQGRQLAQSTVSLPQADAVPASRAIPPEELQDFLVRFVVEQTGYPPEVVSLDADLEADLGIDSIKKAQLFGELREYFPIQPAGNVSLDDFPTLRHVLEFLRRADAGGTGPAVESVESGRRMAPQDLAPQHLPSEELASGGVASQRFGPQQLAPQPLGPQEFAPQQLAPQEFAAKDFGLPKTVPPKTVPPEIAPPEIVHQEVARHEGEAARASAPDAMRGLGRSAGLAANVPPPPPGISKPLAAATPSAGPSSSAVPTASHDALAAKPPENLEAFLVNFVVEQTGYPPEVVSLDADLEADLGIDSIKKAQLFGELREYFPIQPQGNLTLDAFPTLRHVLEFLQRGGQVGSSAGEAAAAEPTAAEPAAATSSWASAESATPRAIHAQGLERRLVDFVVERTGCLPEAVDWDADLEADLGVDPVAKAQLIAALRREWACGDGEPVSADTFMTLRDIRDYFSGRGARHARQS